MEDEALVIFLEEADELISELEQSLLVMENDPKDSDSLNNAFRCIHTVKGGAGVCGANELADYAHQVETLMVQVRDGTIPATTNLISSLLESLDCLKQFIANLRGGPAVDPNLVAHNLQELASYNSLDDQGLSPPAEPLLEIQENETPFSDESPPLSPTEPDSKKSFLIQLRLPENVLDNGIDPLSIIEQLQTLGDLITIPHTDEISALDNFDSTKLKLWWSLKLDTLESKEGIEDELIFYLDNQDVNIIPLDGPPQETMVKAALNAPSALPEKAPDSKSVSLTSPPVNLAGGAQVSLSSKAGASSIRVAISKLDTLVSLVGESILQQSRLNKFQEQVGELNKNLRIDFRKIVKDGALTTNELRTHVMNLRMVPIRGLFSPLHRTVRDYAKQSGKQIVLETRGEETELDKTVIEQINGPLNHLIRNSMDHGIELPSIREEAGKTSHGTIYLTAYHSEGFIIIEIQDDGAGIDTARVLSIAQERQIVEDSGNLTDTEIFQLIFEPGFSTAEKVTDVSGRGVGMDVVRKNIEGLGGSITIDSTPGEGTTIVLQLPLTLAIIDGLLVKVAQTQFILPLAGIEECIEMFNRVKQEEGGQRILKVRDEAIPYISLRDQFGLTGHPPTIEQLVVVNLHQKLVGFVVDQIIGEHRTVIKNLGCIYKDLNEYAGATILGDGTVVLILDLNQLQKKVEEREKRRRF